MLLAIRRPIFFGSIVECFWKSSLPGEASDQVNQQVVVNFAPHFLLARWGQAGIGGISRR